jgi:hypothetical protein
MKEIESSLIKQGLPLVCVLDLVENLAEIVKQVSACFDDFLRKHVLFSVYPKIWKGYNINNHKVTENLKNKM